MSISDEKIKKINAICQSWKGGFTRGEYAMSRISNVLSEKHIQMENVQLIDISTGECILECKSATAVINQ
ncbi:hypothetical protein [Metabacillus fastidiosus]|uniref:hypothetical protein n=1 Tax=Metabacillus fastidiosus TaxID=1458 RepID=UPI003D29568A